MNSVSFSSETSQSADLRLALELADIADSVALPRFRAADLRVDTKPDRTFVTDADTAVEKAVRAHLANTRPDDGFFGEETGTRDANNDDNKRQWIIDPIDGTSNFLRGVPNWATLIALTVDEVPTIGVVSMPAIAQRWWAETGCGAWTQRKRSAPERIRVSGIDSLENASLSFQSIMQWEDAGYLPELLELRRSVWRDRAYGDAWSYMALAEGLLDIVGEFDVAAYDLTAHVPIVREAGGQFTDVLGNESAWNGSSLATNGALHDQVLQKITKH